MRLPLDYQHTAMPWEDIDAVVFDVGNVLVPFQPDKLLRKHLPGEEAHYPALREYVFQSPFWLMLDRGLLTCEEAAEPMSIPCPQLRPAIEHLMRSWPDLTDTIPEGVQALEMCAAMGKKIYVLSNYNNRAFEVVRRKHSFWKHVQGFMISADEGLLKPDLAIFRRLIDEFSLTPERTLFIDDSPVNIEAALHCGLQGICYSREGKLQQFFEF